MGQRRASADLLTDAEQEQFLAALSVEHPVEAAIHRKLFELQLDSPPDSSAIDELARWVIPPGIFRAMGDRRLGTPIRARRKAIHALEVQRANDLSWAKLARKVCWCPEGSPHDKPACVQRVRRAVGELKTLLAKHGIVLPPVEKCL